MTARHRAGFIRRQRRREKRRSNRIGNAHPAIASGSGFGAFNFAALVFLLLARHSPQAVSARAACVGCHQKYRESRDDVAGVLYLFSAKSTDRSLRLVLFAAFWSAVNRGLRPRGTLYFLAAKSTKNSPADACAYFVPSNAGFGRLFAGAHVPRPLRSRF